MYTHMKFNSEKHYHSIDTSQGRRSIRLKGYDYSQPGAYFITICTANRACLFGEVVDGNMQLNPMGHIARQCWLAIPDHFPNTALDEFIIMPNHVHGIIWIVEKPNVENDDANDAIVGATHAIVGATHASPLHTQPNPPRGPKRQSIGAIVGSYKSAVTKRINERRNTPGATVWQRNYYEHVIRNDESLNRIRQYILENPIRWHLDRENPAATGKDTEWEMWINQ